MDILQSSIEEIKSLIKNSTIANVTTPNVNKLEKKDDDGNDVDEGRGDDEDDGFDLIVSNPPYISPREYQTLDPDVRLWEDRCALIANDDGTEFHNRIAYLAANHLLKGRKQRSGGSGRISWRGSSDKNNISEGETMNEFQYPQLVMEIGGSHQVEKVIHHLRKHNFGWAQIWKDAAGKERCVIARL